MHLHIHGAAPFGQTQERENMLLVGMHAARRQQAHDLQAFAPGFGGINGRQQGRIFIEAAVFDGGIDAGKVLIDDAAGADIHVADLGVAHLPVRQTDEFSFRVDQRVRAIAQQAVPIRQVCQGDGVVGAFGAVAPAVQNQQYDRFCHCHAVLLPRPECLPTKGT